MKKRKQSKELEKNKELEKKAMIELNRFSNMTTYWKQEEYTNSEIDNYIKTVLNLIETQQKEIEELKEKNKTLKNLQNDTNGLYIEMIERKNYFERELQKLEAKIKAKIEEIEKE